MRLGLYSKTDSARDPTIWACLPGLCCQAAGGDPQTADPVAEAWLCFYAAAHLMDSLEDQDTLDPWCADLGPAVALNVATGLYFSACLALQELDPQRVDPLTMRDVSALVLSPFLEMCSGQHADFLEPPSDVEAYRRIAAAKSGAFFAMACTAGARLACAQPCALEGYRQFGLNAGIMIQILDDLADFRDLQEGRRPVDGCSLSRTLPVIFMREVCPDDVVDRLDYWLQEAPTNPAAAQEISKLVEDNGGVFYLKTELNLLGELAARGLELAEAIQPARGELAYLLGGLNP